MADLEKIVRLIFEGEGDDLSREMMSLDRQFSDFSSNIQTATQPLADFGMAVAKAEAALIAMGAAGLVYAYGKAKEFESAAIDLDKVLSEQDGLAGGLDTAKQAALEFSDKYGESSSSILQSIADFRQANFDLTESIELSEQAMRLKIAGDLDAAEASQYLKQILSGFKAEASDATTVVDSLNGVSNNYNTSVEQLAIGLGDLSGVATVVGMNFAETEGLLTPIIAVFGSGSEAANALKTSLIRLVDNTAPVVAALDSIGVSQRDANGELKNAYDILGEVARAFENTDKSQQLFIAGEIFGKEQAAKMVQVLNDWDQVLAVTETALNSTGSAQEEVTKRLESAEVAVNRAVVGWENLNIAVGNKFAESATGTVNAFTDIENALRSALGQETFDVVWDAINGFFSDTEQLLKDIATNLPKALESVDFSGLVKAFQDLGAEVGDALDVIFGGDLDLSTVEGLEDAIQRVIDTLAGMTNFTAGFIEGLDPLLAAIGEIAESFGEMDQSGQTLAGDMTGWAQSVNTLFQSLDTLKNILIGIGSILTVGPLSAGLDKIAVGFTSLAGAATAMATGVAAGAVALDTLYDKVLSIAGVDYSGIIDSYFGLGESIQNIVDVLTGKRDWWTGELKTEATEAKIVVEDLSNALGEVPEYLKVTTETDTTSLDELLSLPLIEDGLDTEIRIQNNIAALEKAQAQAATVTGEKEMEIIGYFNGEAVYDEIEKAVPKEKEIEIKPTVLEQAKLDLERDLATIKADADVLQSAFEWNAKVNIADIEAAAETTKAAFDSVGGSVREVSSGVADMFTSLASNLNGMRTSDKWFLMDRLEEQQDKQNELIDSQIELVNAQAEYMRLKNEKIESGELAELKIDSTGLEPALEMVMWQIIEKVQVRANENAQEFLLGLPSV